MLDATSPWTTDLTGFRLSRTIIVARLADRFGCKPEYLLDWNLLPATPDTITLGNGDETMIKRTLLFVILALLTISAIAQKSLTPYSQWTEKDAQKILNDSPWAHTQVETNTSEMFFSPTANPTVGSTSTSADRAARGATNQATSVNFHIRFLTARPIREAFARVIELGQK